MKLLSPRRIYLDYAASTPLSPVVARAMRRAARVYANPSSRHAEGRRARATLEDARASCARVLGVQPHEITFTSGGTEANNLALLGITRALVDPGKPRVKLHVVVSAFEHPSVLACARVLEARGHEVSYVNPDREGMIRPEALAKVLRDDTALVSIMYVNGEIGTVQPLRALSQLVRKKSPRAFIHTDASQAPLYLPLGLHDLGVDCMSIDAQKIYGPKGVGFLAHRRGVPLANILFGGSQEGGLRPGTTPVTLAVGLATALTHASARRATRSARIRALRDYFIGRVRTSLPEARLNGSLEHRIPNNVNIAIPGRDAEYLAARLDAVGISVSTKSACLEGEASSYTVALLGDPERAASSIRFTLGDSTTRRVLDRTLRALNEAVKIVDSHKNA